MSRMVNLPRLANGCPGILKTRSYSACRPCSMLPIDEMSQVDVIIMPSGGFWSGVGAPDTIVAALAVLNAIYTATGKRIREVPLKTLTCDLLR